MIRSVAAALAIALGCACGGSGDAPREPSPLRVSAAHGLSEFTPGPSASGSTAHALELVYEALFEHARVRARKGNTVVLERLAKSSHETAALSNSLKFEGLVQSRVGPDGLIYAVFRTREDADAFGRHEIGAFDLGPYRVANQAEGRVSLVPRISGRQRGIEIIEVAKGEQWKALLGHKIDVVPNLAGLDRHQFAGVGSVRVIDLPGRSHIAVLFNVRNARLAAAPVRRRIARAIDSDAIARLACGDVSCAVRFQAVDADDSAAQLPKRLRVLALSIHAPSMLAAKVLKHQLRKLGIKVDVDAVAIAELGRAISGKYELAIMPVAIGDLAAFTTGMIGSLNITGYSNPVFDAAVKRGAKAAAMRLLALDVPAVPLFEMRQFAAVDRSICGGRGATSVSWKWIAELRLCDEDER